jgi:hypothetical protein
VFYRSMGAERHEVRRLVLSAALTAALVSLALTGAVRGGGVTITLDPDDQDTNSAFLKFVSCTNPVTTGLIQWTFELSGVTPGQTSALNLVATFTGDGVIGPSASTWDGTGALHTFHVTTTGNDTLSTATVTMPPAVTATSLDLVGLCFGNVAAATPVASLADAAMTAPQPAGPGLFFIGVLLMALAALATVRAFSGRNRSGTS